MTAPSQSRKREPADPGTDRLRTGLDHLETVHADQERGGPYATHIWNVTGLARGAT